MNTSAYPNESLRKKLVVAGIPESEHSLELLSARIPGDFNTRSLRDLSADMLAELLLYFIAKGILALPIPASKALLNMAWGTHACQFYHSKNDLLEMLVPYYKQGLERNDACMWLVSDLTIAEAKKALAAAVPALEHYVDSGQMKIRHYSELYTNPNGTVKPPDQLTEQLVEMGTSVKAEGFNGLRMSSSVSWINNKESMARLMDYETQVNKAIRNSSIMAVCAYPARAAAMCRCRELIHNHDKFLVKRGAWVHDMSPDVEKIEAVFASLAAL